MAASNEAKLARQVAPRWVRHAKSGFGRRLAYARRENFSSAALMSSVASTAETPKRPGTSNRRRLNQHAAGQRAAKKHRPQMRLGGQDLNYTATVGWLILKTQKGGEHDKDGKDGE